MSSTRGKQAGWAAFGHNHRQKQGLEPQNSKDPYPPIPSSFSPLRKTLTRNSDPSIRPFSSVVLPSVDFPTLTESKANKKHIQTIHSNSRGNLGEEVAENNYDLAVKRLKTLHSWADDSLIEDIMAAADNDFEKASTLFKGMASSSSSSIDRVSCDRKADDSITSERDLHTSDLSSTDENTVKENQTKLIDLYASQELKLSDNATDMRMIIEHLRSLPVEPEWEEDDIYLSHRRDAIKMMRSASQHSKAATNAFLRGDHSSAKQHSQKAQEEWLVAARLNSKAANEILSIRNSKNDMWTLDLHGLHAAEAVQALQERLRKLEIRPPANRSVSPNRVKQKNGMIRTPSVDSVTHMDIGNLDKQQSSFRHVRKTLEIITGVGNHSRGQASLPSAVRNFLTEYGYHFEEPRPGIITVRPKVHHR